jgi:hypothetical protein
MITCLLVCCSKNYPVIVPLLEASLAIRDAIDTIGAYSRLNPEWNAVADQEVCEI